MIYIIELVIFVR